MDSPQTPPQGSRRAARCTFGFTHAGRPRNSCNLRVLVVGDSTQPRCPWHDPKCRPTEFDVRSQLTAEIARSDHWLEGARLDSMDLTDLTGRGAKLPRAELNGAKLVRADLGRSILDGATLAGADCQEALFDSATFVRANLSQTRFQRSTLTRADLSGSVLAGAEFDRAALLGLTLSAETASEMAIWGVPEELSTNQFAESAAVFRALRRHYRERSDNRMATHFYELEMTAMHAMEIGAVFSERIRRPLLWAPARLGLLPPWAGWWLHRIVWGYGVRPLRTLACMLAVISTFGLVVFPMNGVRAGESGPVSHQIIDGLKLSFVTFSTLGYGNRFPCGEFGEIWAGVEAGLGALLISTFVVALSTRYVATS